MGRKKDTKTQLERARRRSEKCVNRQIINSLTKKSSQLDIESREWDDNEDRLDAKLLEEGEE